MSTASIAAPAPSELRIARRETFGQLLRSPTFIAGAVIVGFWVFCAIFGSLIAPHDPQDQSFTALLKPSGDHFFGTDSLGRDVFSRVLVGARDILEVAPLATLLGIAGGTVIGLVTGYRRGLVDDAVSRVVDAWLALPLIVIAVTVFVALGTAGTSKAAIIVVIGVVFIPIVSRTVRAAVLGEGQLEYVQAARLRGERAPYIMLVEILPNVMGPIIVETTVRLGYAIFAVAGLTFLGFGVQPPAPDWSLQISDGYQLLNDTAHQGNYWVVLFPGAAIASLVIGINLISDGISRVLER
jgi:peptide/nickel transport system permease protein